MMIPRINQQKADRETVYTTREVADLTGYHPKTIQRLAKEGVLPRGGSPGKWLFRADAIRDFLGVTE